MEPIEVGPFDIKAVSGDPFTVNETMYSHLTPWVRTDFVPVPPTADGKYDEMWKNKTSVVSVNFVGATGSGKTDTARGLTSRILGSLMEDGDAAVEAGSITKGSHKTSMKIVECAPLSVKIGGKELPGAYMYRFIYPSDNEEPAKPPGDWFLHVYTNLKEGKIALYTKWDGSHEDYLEYPDTVAKDKVTEGLRAKCRAGFSDFGKWVDVTKYARGGSSAKVEESIQRIVVNPIDAVRLSEKTAANFGDKGSSRSGVWTFYRDEKVMVDGTENGKMVTNVVIFFDTPGVEVFSLDSVTKRQIIAAEIPNPVDRDPSGKFRPFPGKISSYTDPEDNVPRDYFSNLGPPLPGGRVAPPPTKGKTEKGPGDYKIVREDNLKQALKDVKENFHPSSTEWIILSVRHFLRGLRAAEGGTSKRGEDNQKRIVNRSEDVSGTSRDWILNHWNDWLSGEILRDGKKAGSGSTSLTVFGSGMKTSLENFLKASFSLGDVVYKLMSPHKPDFFNIITAAPQVTKYVIDELHKIILNPYSSRGDVETINGTSSSMYARKVSPAKDAIKNEVSTLVASLWTDQSRLVSAASRIRQLDDNRIEFGLDREERDEYTALQSRVGELAHSNMALMGALGRVFSLHIDEKEHSRREEENELKLYGHRSAQQ
jgi:hypothetical protein